MRAALLGLVCLTLALAACGGGQEQDKAERQPAPLGPGQVVKRAATLRTATVRGRAYPVSDDRLVLAGPQQSIFAFADAAVVRRVGSPGEQIVVQGAVRRLSAEQATELERELDALPANRRPPEVERVKRDVGGPYLDVQPTPSG